MNTCANCQKPKTDLAAYRMPMRGTVRVFCRDCAESLIGLGMSWSPVERRSESLPVVTERRRSRSAWLTRLTARDETGRMTA